MQSNALPPSQVPPSRVPPSRLPPRAAGRFDIGAEASTSASRRGWDEHCADYQSEHGTWLAGDGAGALIWCPQGWDEAEVSLLGDCSALAGRSVVDIGSGGGQAAMWLANQGADVVGVDISHAQLTYAQLTHASAARRAPLPPNDSGVTKTGVTKTASSDPGVANCGAHDFGATEWLQADAAALPLASEAFDIAISAFGALAFTPSSDVFFAEIARVLKPAGVAVISTPHPMRWIFPDDPGQPGLTAVQPYFDRTPYVETDDNGQPAYVEHHHTMSDIVTSVHNAGLSLERMWEPEWSDGHDRVWGGWGPITGAIYPRTLIIRCSKPA